MAKIDFYTIDKEEKIAIFTEIATQMGMKPFAVEKDWWVSRTLEIIFQMPIAQHLVFKGGTSLSKAWKLINRFSEDIDLAIRSEERRVGKECSAQWARVHGDGRQQA